MDWGRTCPGIMKPDGPSNHQAPRLQIPQWGPPTGEEIPQWGPPTGEGNPCRKWQVRPRAKIVKPAQRQRSPQKAHPVTRHHHSQGNDPVPGSTDAPREGEDHCTGARHSAWCPR